MINLKVMQAFALIALLVANVYLWQTVDVMPSCEKSDNPSIVLALFLQICWAFLLIKPEYLTLTLSVPIKRRQPHATEEKIEQLARYISLIFLLLFALFTIQLLRDGLSGASRAAGGHQCVYPKQSIKVTLLFSAR